MEVGEGMVGGDVSVYGGVGSGLSEKGGDVNLKGGSGSGEGG